MENSCRMLLESSKIFGGLLKGKGNPIVLKIGGNGEVVVMVVSPKNGGVSVKRRDVLGKMGDHANGVNYYDD